MKITIPTNCPCCDSKLEMVNEQLFCRNVSCSAQLNKKLEHFTKTLGIKGFGPKTVEKLELNDLLEIFYLDPKTVAIALGSEKVAAKLLDEIERAKSSDFATVLASFSIPLIGNTASTKVAQVVSNFDEITQTVCKEAGLGDKATQNLCDWIATDYRELSEFLPFSFSPITKVVPDTNSPTICITGKLSSYKTKAEATSVLVAAGFKVVEAVTKSLDYLIDEEDKSSSKRTKAEQYGVTIIPNLNTFLKEITNE